MPLARNSRERRRQAQPRGNVVGASHRFQQRTHMPLSSGIRVRKAACFGILALVGALTTASAPAGKSDAMCSRYFGSACSEAIGKWLPRVPNAWIAPTLAMRTTVRDHIIDPAGSGPLTFLGMRGVYRGTHFVYGSAGPPQGHAVYDPVHRIAYYDEGCCSWHELVIASNAKAPPKTIAMRSLVTLRTQKGIQLGDGPSLIESIYGWAQLRPVARASHQRTFSYYRVIKYSQVYSSCDEHTTFLFSYERLVAIDITDEC